MKLRPYHNPENIDESKVPPGWRFRYADELINEPTEVAILSVVGWKTVMAAPVFRFPGRTLLYPVNPTTL
jgi:hypothetical protein